MIRNDRRLSALESLALGLGRAISGFVTRADLDGAIRALRGDKGDRGEQGPKGDRGEQGPKGDPGPKGDKGDRGEQGVSIKGDKGDRGANGDKGDAGLAGRDGRDGDPGPKGDRGDAGKDGAAGVGIKGDKGDAGPRGERGDSGLKGDRGDLGPAGRDADPYAVEGWTPVLALTPHGARVIMQVRDWTRLTLGGGAKPEVGLFVGPEGFTRDPNQATNLRGLDGAAAPPLGAGVGGGLRSFNGRKGAIVPLQEDYDQFFTTEQEASDAAPVQSVHGRTGEVVAQQSDYDAFFTTTAEAADAAPVQSVAGRTGDVVLVKSDVGLSNVVDPVASKSVNNADQALTQTLTSIASFAAPANSLAVGNRIHAEIHLGGITEGSAVNGSVEVALFVGGTQAALVTIACGALAVTNIGGRFALSAVVKSIGSSGTVLANGFGTIAGITPQATANLDAAKVTANTTGTLAFDLRARTTTASLVAASAMAQVWMEPV